MNWTSCDVPLPPFGVTVGGKTLYMGDEDIQNPGTRDEQGRCAVNLIHPCLFNAENPDGRTFRERRS